MGDVIYDETLDAPTLADASCVTDSETSYDFTGLTHHDLLVKMVEHGRRAGDPDELEAAKRRCKDALMHLDPAVRRFLNPQVYPVGVERNLAELRARLVREERAAQR